MNDWDNWVITYDDRSKHDENFRLLHPVNGFITGEQARDFFIQSKLPTPVLAKIWALADLTADGKLDRKEFSIAMFLIKKSLEGNGLPTELPPSLLQERQRSIPSTVLPLNTQSTNSVSTNNTTVNSIHSSEWSISAALRPKYKLQFNQNDRNKRGYLTGVEARGIFLKSNLPQSQLAAIWNLADVDKDGNLTCEEFCIAAYLIDQVLSGRKLPPTLPSALMPSILSQQGERPKSTPIDGEQKGEPEGRMTFEDKRMQNFLLGQAELDKRKQDLAEQLRQEEEQRREQARFELEKKERIRQERERQRQRQAEAEAEKARAIEARLQEAATSQLQKTREELRRRALDAEKSRIEALIKECSRQSQALEQAKADFVRLEESAATQTARREAVQSRISAAQMEVEAHKAVILKLATQRDTVERDCIEVTEQVEAARAELNRWQREHEQLQRQLAPPPQRVLDITNTTEQQKTLRASLKQVQDSKRQLEQQLAQLETEVLRGGQTLASHRHSADELAKKRTHLITEVSALFETLLERRCTYRQQHYQRQKEQEVGGGLSTIVKQKDLDTINSIMSTALNAGPSVTYTALYPYTAIRLDELTFVECDKIQIFTKPPFEVCEGWLFGEMDGRRGLVPASYVRKATDETIETASTTNADPFALPNTASSAVTAATNLFSDFTCSVDKPNSLPLVDEKPMNYDGEKPLFKCLALYNFEAKLPGDLNLQIGDKVDVYMDNDGWYEGVSQRTGNRGLFPANHVQKLQPDAEITSTFGMPTGEKNVLNASPPSLPPAVEVHQEEGHQVNEEKAEFDPSVITVSETPELAIVVTPFTSKSTEQLSLNVGQYVKIRKRSSKGWWEGEIQQRGQDRQIGWFPADYVRLAKPNNVEDQPPTTSNEPTRELGPVISESVTATVSATPPPPTIETKIQNPDPVVTSTATSGLSVTSPSTTTNLASASVVQSMFAYKACQPDEMTFPEGALIEVLAHEEEGWWRGRIQSTGIEGLFPVNYVKPFQSETLSAPTSAPSSSSKPSAGDLGHSEAAVLDQDCCSIRRNVILELIDSEYTYFRDLVEVKEERKIKLKKGLSDIIGDILIRHLPKCVAYREFCASQDLALKSLQKLCDESPDIALFLRSCEHFMRVRSMPLSSYLLKPMQRITKYKLLIEKVLKYTPSDHPDHDNLEKSFELVSTVLEVCNEAVRHRECFAKLQQLQDHITFDGDTGGLRIFGQDDKRLSDTEIEIGGERRLRLLLFSGSLFKVKSRKELTAFLFTDVLLLTQPVNFSASALPSGNFSMTLKPDSTLAKANFKAYKRPISLAQIRLFNSTSLSSKRRSRSLFHGSIERSSLADFPSITNANGDHVVSSSTGNKEIRSKRLSMESLRQLSLSLNNLSGTQVAATRNGKNMPFVIADDGDPTVRIMVRAPSEQLRTMWVEGIRKAAMEYQQYLSQFKTTCHSNLLTESLFAGVLHLTIFSASDLPMVGPNEDELPWPYCEASLCLRSKRTKVILSTCSPKWNCSMRFAVKDLNRDVITLYIYSKNASSAAELLGKAEMGMPQIMEHCQDNALWKTTLPIILNNAHVNCASVAAQSLVKEINVGPEVDPEYAVWFQLIFWFVVVFATVIWEVCCYLSNMDPGRDGIIYRLSVNKPKSE